MFAYGNVLAVVAIVFVSIVGGSRVAPMLSHTGRWFFATLVPSSIPYTVGQFGQEGEWGPLWMQYHLCDLVYGSWGVAIGMCIVWTGGRCIGVDFSEKVLIAISFASITFVGYVTEFWDTYWVWRGKGSLAAAVDVGDYVTISTGIAVTAILYVLTRQFGHMRRTAS